MSHISFDAANNSIEEERRAKYCGTASLRIDVLRFDHRNKMKLGSSAAKNAAVLARIFREERGCRQEDVQNHATAVISQQTLEVALSNCKIPRSSLTADNIPYPQLELPPGVTLACLQGQNRLVAAENVFERPGQRWVVDLYRDDLSDNLVRKLVEHYNYQKAPDDGEMYCKIREYEGFPDRETKNLFFERLWRGRLASVSQSRLSNFEQLSNSRIYCATFDELLKIPALLGGLRLSVLHEVFPMRCDEQNIHYLNSMFMWWYKLCKGDNNLMLRIDRSTVEKLQGKAPGASRHDYGSLRRSFEKGEIFRDIPDREGFWSRTVELSKTGLILSLHTFFEDRKLLDLVSESMRYLLKIEARDSISDQLKSAFSDPIQEAQTGRCIIQQSNGYYFTIPGDKATRLEFGIRQLWLTAIREYESLPPRLQKKSHVAKARTKHDEGVLYDFAYLARRLGFESAEIREILSRPADYAIAERALLTARRPDCYEYDDEEQLIEHIVHVFAEARPIAPERLLAQQHNAEPQQPPTRYGLPEVADHARDKARLFLPHMKAVITYATENHISSIFVRNSVYVAYFGEPQLPEGCQELIPLQQTPVPPGALRMDEDYDMGLGDEYICQTENPFQSDEEACMPHQPQKAIHTGRESHGKQHCTPSQPTMPMNEVGREQQMCSEQVEAHKEVKKLEQKAKELNEQLDAAHQEVEALKSQRDGVQQEVEAFKSQRDSVQQEVRKLHDAQTVLEQKREEWRELAGKEHDLSEKCKATAKELEILTRQSNDEREAQQKASNEVAMNLHKRRTRPTEDLKVRRRVEDLGKQNEIQRTALEKQRQEVEKLSTQKQNLASVVADLANQHEVQEKALKEKQQELQRLLEDVADVRRKGREAEEQLPSLQQHTTEAQNTLVVLQQEAKAQRKVLDDLEAEKTLKQQQASRQKDECKDIQNSIAAEQAALESLKAEIQTRRENSDQVLNKEIASMQLAKNDVTEQSKVLQQKCEELQQLASEEESLRQKGMKALQELNSLQIQAKDEETALLAKKEELQNLSEEEKRQLRDVQALGKKYEDDQKHYQNTIDNKKKALFKLEKQVDDTDKVLQDKQKSLNKLAEEEDAGSKKVAAAQKQLQYLEQLISNERTASDGRRVIAEAEKVAGRELLQLTLNETHDLTNLRAQTEAQKEELKNTRNSIDEARAALEKLKQDYQIERKRADEDIDNKTANLQVAKDDVAQQNEKLRDHIFQSNAILEELQESQAERNPPLEQVTSQNTVFGAGTAEGQAERSGSSINRITKQDWLQWFKITSKRELQLRSADYVFFGYREGANWVVSDAVNCLDSALVRTVALKYDRKDFALYNMHGQKLSADDCYRRVKEDKSFSVLLVTAEVLKSVQPESLTKKTRKEEEGKGDEEKGEEEKLAEEKKQRRVEKGQRRIERRKEVGNKGEEMEDVRIEDSAR